MPVNVAAYTHKMGTSPNTRTAVSQKSKVYSYGVGSKTFQQMGVISEFGHDESRTIDTVRGVGYGDLIAELVPSVTEATTLTLNKTLLYTANLFQLTGYKGGIDGLVRSLRHHRWPFDIKQELVFSEIASADPGVGVNPAGNPIVPNITDAAGNTPTGILTPIFALITFFEGCWFNSYSRSYTSDAGMVAENSSVTVTDVHDGASAYGEYIDSGLAPIGDNGSAGQGFSVRFA